MEQEQANDNIDDTFSLALTDAGDVVAILDDCRVLLGHKDAVVEEMCRFLAKMDTASVVEVRAGDDAVDPPRV